MKAYLLALLLIAASASGPVQATGHQPGASSGEAIYLQYPAMKWEKTNPELGDRSPEISFLHKDRKTGATKLMIRVPANFHVPKHWPQPMKRTPLSQAHSL